MAEVGAARDGQKRRKIMSAEVFETPDPEVTFRPYAAANAAARGASRASGADDAHFLDKGDVQLDEDAVAPARAFEVFMGKVYKPMLHSQTAFEAERVVNGGPKALESPLARFTRLSVEAEELAADLALLAAGAEQRKHVALVDAAQDAELGEVMRGLAALRSNLSAMETDARFQPFLLQSGGGGSSGDGANYSSDAALALQKDLTARFFQQLDALKRSSSGSTSVPGSAPGSAPIVYEIYSSGEVNAVDRGAKSRVAALEARLAALERLVGGFNVRQTGADGLSSPFALSGGLEGEGGAVDVSSAVSRLEQRVNLLNEKNLDAIKTRTTALVHELTLLGKLKESPGVQGALSVQADRERLQQTHEALASVADVAAAVPALVDRLASLKAVHDDSLAAGERVRRLERSHEALAELLESDAAVLANMEASLAANVDVFQANMQRLDERMEKLLRVR